MILPCLSMLWPIAPEVDLVENRILAPFPKFPEERSGFEDFTSAMDRYLDDHFGFRNVLALLELRWSTLVAKKPVVQSVLFGRNGWLFYADDDAMTQYRNLLPLMKEQSIDLVKKIREQHEFCRNKGIRYLLLVAPNKISIYPEHKPSWLTAREAPNLMDQLVTSLRNETDVPVVDLRRVMLEFKQESVYGKDYPLYWKTDTHWTRMGAFLACKGTIDTLRKWFPKVPEINYSNVKTKIGFRNGGDLAKMVGMDQNVVEVSPVLNPKQSAAAKEIEIPMSYKSLYALKGDSDPRFLIAESWNRELPKAVMFRDSFGNALTSLLSEHFSRIVYRWHFLKTFHFDIDLIDRESPDVVIYQVVERSLIQNFRLANPPSLHREEK